jgi:hypothetical protein
MERRRKKTEMTKKDWLLLCTGARGRFDRLVRQLRIRPEQLITYQALARDRELVP